MMLQFFRDILDSYHIIRGKEKFILGLLADRAMQSEEGYVLTHVLPIIRGYPVAVLTDKKIIENVLKCTNSDPEARKMFQSFEVFLGIKTLINEFELSKVREEKKKIKMALSQISLASCPKIDSVLSELAQEWEKEPIEKVVRLVCVRLIASALLGIEEGITYETTLLLQEGASYLFSPHRMNEAGFKLLKEKMQKESKWLIEKNKKNMEKSECLNYMCEKNGKKIEEINVVAILIVESNITHLITEILSKVAHKPEWQNRLFEEFKKESSRNDSEVISFSEQLFFEGVRCFPPEQPIVRYASQEISPFPKGTLFFIPIRKIMNDPRKWDKPEDFNPSRHISRSELRMGTYPWLSFSLNVGQRVCPALNSGFVKTVLKKVLVSYCKVRCAPKKESSLLFYYPHQSTGAPCSHSRSSHLVALPLCRPGLKQVRP